MPETPLQQTAESTQSYFQVCRVAIAVDRINVPDIEPGGDEPYPQCIARTSIS